VIHCWNRTTKFFLNICWNTNVMCHFKPTLSKPSSFVMNFLQLGCTSFPWCSMNKFMEINFKKFMSNLKINIYFVMEKLKEWFGLPNALDAISELMFQYSTSRCFKICITKLNKIVFLCCLNCNSLPKKNYEHFYKFARSNVHGFKVFCKFGFCLILVRVLEMQVLIIFIFRWKDDPLINCIMMVPFKEETNMPF
jgi:hypothetical protein